MLLLRRTGNYDVIQLRANAFDSSQGGFHTSLENGRSSRDAKRQPLDMVHALGRINRQNCGGFIRDLELLVGLGQVQCRENLPAFELC